MNYKFSIISPSHKNTPYLQELYESLCAQTYGNWEWVLWLNGTFKRSKLSPEIENDERVKIYECNEKNSNVGFHKNKAFHLGSGDILVEVDHDDMITPNCLEELNKAYQDERIGFVYSDVAVYDDNFVPYNEQHGWSYYFYNFRGKDRYVMNSWRPTSQSLAFIWYAPDHVRSWRKSVYEKIGGHNVDLCICDDHELMIRTYLKTKMYHIKKPLYIYRVYGQNTYLERNAQIQTKTVDLYHQYGYQLSEKDSIDRNLLMVDISGSFYAKDGYQKIDIVDDVIPLPDNSVGVLNALHILQRLKDPIKSMREIHRVLAHGGWAMIEVPSTDGRGAFQDPRHISYWNQHSFWYYTNRDQAKFISNEDIRFQSYRLDTIETSPHIKITKAWLSAIKGDERLPGILNI